MRQKNSKLLIGIDSSGLCSDFDQNHLQIQTRDQSTPHSSSCLPTQSQTHLRTQIPSLSSSLHFPSSNPSSPLTSASPSPRQIHFRLQDELICNIAPSSKTLPSTPHKRPIMSQTPSARPRAPTFSSLRHCHNAPAFDLESSKASFLCSSSFAAGLATKTVCLRLLRHFYRVRWLRVHFRLLILLSLPTLYFLASDHHRAFLFDFLPILAFSAALVISLNLALPRLPSIRLFFTRSFPIKLSSATTASNPHPLVVWSIGSKPKSERRPDSGSWVQVYRNGDVYEGEFHRGKCSGSGVYDYHMTGRYEGDWVDEKYDGYGVETWARGSRYRGQYRRGLRHGMGVYRFYTGDVYAGEWSNGQCHGCGVHTCEDGSCYVGEFKWGVKHGLGHYHFRNGDIYAGEYFANKMHGFGVYRFANGHRYEGAWHEGRRQGLGMYTFRNGDLHSGHWQNGILNVSSAQTALPGSPCTANHARVINAVQEAQRAAQRAYDVARVDERVSKAVAAANKAANAARVAAVKAVQNQMHRDNYSNDDGGSNQTT